VVNATAIASTVENYPSVQQLTSDAGRAGAATRNTAASAVAATAVAVERAASDTNTSDTSSDTTSDTTIVQGSSVADSSAQPSFATSSEVDTINLNLFLGEVKVISDVSVSRVGIVRMRVRMVEFRKSALGRLGIDWSDSATGPSLAASGVALSNSQFQPAGVGLEGLSNTVAPFSTYFGIASNITSRINFLARNGDAVTLAEPVLSAMNGGQASFLAGGEVPYPTIGANGQTQIEFKEYGVKLNVSPLIDSAGNVRATVETEISQLDSSVSIQGTPGLLTRRAQTDVTVRSGQTIVISGLLSSESSADTDMIPGIGRLPIIGRFFSSKGQSNSANELVIFVTPEVIEPGEPVMSRRETQYLIQSDKRVMDARKQLPLME